MQTTEPLISFSPPDPSIPSSSAKRVLVTDDEPGIRYILERALSSAGYIVSCASDGEEAWAELCKENFDLLVTDHDMPKLTGVNLIRRLRAFSSSLPVLLVSGQTPWAIPDLLEILRPGFALEKPFTFPELLGHVNHLVGQAAAPEATDRDSPAAIPPHEHKKVSTPAMFADIQSFVRPKFPSLQGAH